MAPLAPDRKEGVLGHTGSRSIQGSLKHNIRGEDAPPKEINCTQTMDSPGIALASSALKTPLCSLTGQGALPRGISGALHPTVDGGCHSRGAGTPGRGILHSGGRGQRGEERGSREKGFVPLSGAASGKEAHEVQGAAETI